MNFITNSIFYKSLLILSVSIFLISGCQDQSSQNHKMSGVIEGFHLYSYYAGSAFTASEFVSAGCKKIAISPTYTEEELNILLEPSKMAAAEYKIPYYVERDFLTTKLFNPSLTDGKIVILFAQNMTILEEYFALKAKKKDAVENGTYHEIENEIAWKFGKLLSYSDEKINELIAQKKD